MASHVKYFFVMLSLFLLVPPAFSLDQPTDGAPVPGPVPTAGPANKTSKSVEDYTDKLHLIPGIVITFPIVEGIDTRRKKLGDYDFTANIQDSQENCWTDEAHGSFYDVTAI